MLGYFCCRLTRSSSQIAVSNLLHAGEAPCSTMQHKVHTTHMYNIMHALTHVSHRCVCVCVCETYPICLTASAAHSVMYTTNAHAGLCLTCSRGSFAASSYKRPRESKHSKWVLCSNRAISRSSFVMPLRRGLEGPARKEKAGVKFTRSQTLYRAAQEGEPCTSLKG